MTTYLLDTQVLIWWFESSEKLPKKIEEFIKSENKKVVSVASVWEIIIKTMAGKLKLEKPLAFLLKNMEFDILAIELEHVLMLNKLPKIHNDPFDRILIAQSKVEKFDLLTTDEKNKKYFT